MKKWMLICMIWLMCGVLALTVGAAQTDALPDGHFATSDELYQYWNSTYPPQYPDYIGGVWTDNGTTYPLTFALTDDAAGQAGKQEILRLRDEGATIIFSTHNMSSVEEICDHITLINKSENILSGRLDEVRHRHGNNIFRIAYRGEEAQLQRALEGRCDLLGVEEEGSARYNTLKIHVERDEDVRSVIAAANEAVELRQFTEEVPSMNDIFIRACQHE